MGHKEIDGKFVKYSYDPRKHSMEHLALVDWIFHFFTCFSSASLLNDVSASVFLLSISEDLLASLAQTVHSSHVATGVSLAVLSLKT